MMQNNKNKKKKGNIQILEGIALYHYLLLSLLLAKALEEEEGGCSVYVLH
jgi:hypothetical protein